eukprot:CAMPEP_0177222936 /NCGR_PEP_ID=MMETSP0367-20130122/38207_1 /TAXON_ID=447022 ORGANISM="Scrippsiella hangoei-like, Strain SHHI-4" /NCGR_SAMPLE_ID=MMETSP0367 /ASSEMBLY_ACC=CAM_ASM_000362 /LENGTH=51 /DNA_ID=CAMNT_0018672853 /DNA_START=269 /DNA_END=421 /DNA_ORIENTATION=+
MKALRKLGHAKGASNPLAAGVGTVVTSKAATGEGTPTSGGPASGPSTSREP